MFHLVKRLPVSTITTTITRHSHYKTIPSDDKQYTSGFFESYVS